MGDKNVRENLSLQLMELEMLQSIFSKPGEIIFDDPLILETVTTYINNKLMEEKPPNISFKINLSEQNFEITITLPYTYPSKEPDIFVRGDALSKTEHSNLNRECKDYLENLPRGEECLFSIITWLQENFQHNNIDVASNLLDLKILPKELTRMWIYSHHIYNKTKRREILNLAQNLNLTGFCMPGKPGVICIEGDVKDCNEWWQTIKSMTWQRIVCRVTEECTKPETFLKFKNFEEVAFTTGGSRSNHANIGELNKYLQEHQLGYYTMESGYLPVPKGFATRAIHAGQDPDKWDSMCVVPPLVMSTTFKQYSPGDYKEFEYGRSGNPTRDVLEKCMASMENAKYGLCYSSGLGALSTILGMFKSGDHFISGDDIYGGTFRLFNKIACDFGFDASFVDGTDVSNIVKAIRPNTKMIWVETPTNPTLKVMDIKAISAIAKKHDILLAVDNTFLTSYLQRPLELGADLSVYSLTKYMNGHSDVIMGAIMLNNKEYYEKLKFLQYAMGIVPSPFDCAQVNRSLKTLAVRMRQHSESAMKIGKYLENHPKVISVRHPGLPSHPQHEIYKKQTSGHSGMVSFYLKGKLEESKKFLSSLKVFTLAESLGGYESLAELPSVMTHASVPEEIREKLKITDNLVRLSVGLEDVEDLIEDLEQALNSF